MTLSNIQEITEVIKMPEAEFRESVLPLADAQRKASFSDALSVRAMIGYSNICKNRCLYCGMRAGNSLMKRFRIPADTVTELGLAAADKGYGRIFLISGEDPKYGFDNLLRFVHAFKARGMFISLACGELEAAQYRELADAGVDEYVLKFEMSDPENFNRLNPSTNFKKRMDAILTIKSLGFQLASGNIIDWPGQTDEELAEDILLMKELEISWAPVIPYLPALGTPLAEEGGRGSLLKLYKEIAILRLMMPRVNITAQQPGEDMKKGLSDPAGNLAAIHAGANVLFFDLLPDPFAQSFRVIDDRNITGPGHIFKIAEEGPFTLDTGKETLVETKSDKEDAQ